MVILAVLSAVIVVVAVVGFVVTRAEPASDSVGTTRSLTYKASSTGKSVIVTFTRGADEVDGQAAGASPWSFATAVDSRVAVLTVNGSNLDQTESVTCAIVDTATGETLASNTAPPSVGGSVTCVTGNLKS